MSKKIVGVAPEDAFAPIKRSTDIISSELVKYYNLLLAPYENHDEELYEVLRAQEDVNQYTPLQQAMHFAQAADVLTPLLNRIERAKYSAEQKAAIAFSRDAGGRTFFCNLLYRCNVDTFEQVVNAFGANIFKKNLQLKSVYGATPLHFLVCSTVYSRAKRMEFVRKLLAPEAKAELSAEHTEFVPSVETLLLPFKVKQKMMCCWSTRCK